MNILHIINGSPDQANYRPTYKLQARTIRQTKTPTSHSTTSELGNIDEVKFLTKGRYPIIVATTIDTTSTWSDKLISTLNLCPDYNVTGNQTLIINIELHGSKDWFHILPAATQVQNQQSCSIAKLDTINNIIKAAKLIGYKKIYIIDSSCSTPNGWTPASSEVLLQATPSTIHMMKDPTAYFAPITQAKVCTHEQFPDQALLVTARDPQQFGLHFKIPSKKELINGVQKYYWRSIADLVNVVLDQLPTHCPRCMSDILSLELSYLTLNLSVEDRTAVLSEPYASPLYPRLTQARHNFEYYDFDAAADTKYSRQALLLAISSPGFGMKRPCDCPTPHAIPLFL